MPTLREWLNDSQFDWSTGIIVYQETEYYWDDPIKAEQIDFYRPILDKIFDDGFGGPEAPLFIASDVDFLYFADNYDGAQRINKIAKDITFYLDIQHRIPVPGGG